MRWVGGSRPLGVGTRLLVWGHALQGSPDYQTQGHPRPQEAFDAQIKSPMNRGPDFGRGRGEGGHHGPNVAAALE